MIWVILIVGIAVTVFGAILISKSYDYEGVGFAIIIIGGLIAFTSLVVALFLLSEMPSYYGIDEKIEMYEEENAAIEASISLLVKEYMDYEEGIFTECAPESTMTLIALYPELKANTLVEKQIETYVNNNNTIKELKSKRITVSLFNWWLYFGK